MVSFQLCTIDGHLTCLVVVARDGQDLQHVLQEATASR